MNDKGIAIMQDSIETISARQLRSLLFHLDNQDMTIRELRMKLFRIEDQDKQVPATFGFDRNLGIA